MHIAFNVWLETARLLQASDIEALYIIFDDAVQERLISCRVERRAVTSVKGCNGRFR
jgi:hypothetical protein